jgi:hypothetical protein
VERHLTTCQVRAGEVRALSRLGEAVAAGAPDAPHPAASLARTNGRDSIGSSGSRLARSCRGCRRSGARRHAWLAPCSQRSWR